MTPYIRNGLITFDELPEIRRQAYVDCVMIRSGEDNLAGIFGTRVNEPLIRSFGFKTVPIEGIDSHIFSFGDCEGCDVIRSTLIYLQTQKCPILFSCNFFVMDRFCPSMIDALSSHTSREVIVYQNKNQLIDCLEKKTKTSYDPVKHRQCLELFKQIRSLEQQLEQSSLDTKQLFELKFFSSYFVDLSERISFLKQAVNCIEYDKKRTRKTFYMMCPGGAYQNLPRDINGKNYRLVRGRTYADATYPECFVDANLHLSYGKED